MSASLKRAGTSLAARDHRLEILADAHGAPRRGGPLGSEGRRVDDFLGAFRLDGEGTAPVRSVAPQLGLG